MNDVISNFTETPVFTSSAAAEPKHQGAAWTLLLVPVAFLGIGAAKMAGFANHRYDRTEPFSPIKGAEGGVFVLLTNTLGPLFALCISPWPSKSMLWGALLVWYIQMVGVLVGHHRHFSHRGFEARWILRVALAVAGCISGQGGPIQWAALHRHHHDRCEEEDDTHSPVKFGKSFWGRVKGFFWAQGLYLSEDLPKMILQELVSDLLQWPEIVFIESMFQVIFFGYAIMCLQFGGVAGLAWLWLMPTFGSWNCVQLVNSACHLIGERKYYVPQAPACEPRNVWWLSLFMLGDNWHNNHHAYASTARAGFEWWELDLNYLLICLFYYLGLVSSIRQPNKKVMLLQAEGEKQEQEQQQKATVNSKKEKTN